MTVAEPWRWPTPITLPLSWLYGSGVSWRNRFYDARGRRGAIPKLSVPVVSVGNLTAGGSGKTPFVETIARRLLASGHRVAVLSRGYGRRSNEAFTLVSDGEAVLASAYEAGDEPVELARKVPGLVVAVGADRYRSGRRLIEERGEHVLLLDDGFQHRGLHRDRDFVCFDVDESPEGLRLLPRGRLREPLSSLRRAGALVWTRWREGRPNDELARRVESALPPDAPVLRARAVILGLYPVGGGEPLEASALRGEPVAVTAGLARPERILDDVDARVVLFEPRRDHHSWSADELEALSERASRKGARALVTSGKDAVKIAPLAPYRSRLPIYELRIALEVVESARLDALLQFSGSA